MYDLKGITHHPAIEEIVDVLCAKTQNTDKGFFRVETAYFLGKLAAAMRATISTKDRGDIPINIYTLALATSGYGKGHSVNILETEFLRDYKTRFMDETFPMLAEKHLSDMAVTRSIRSGTTEEEEMTKLDAEFKRAGAYPFTFDSGTAPAVKQLRQKLLLANCGSINLQIDEIGSNLSNVTEVLTLYLELYDQGIVKQKLTKNTADSQRNEEIDGKTPTNMLLFGTPSKLFDGSQTEDLFYSFLETGYARRCLFGYGTQGIRSTNGQTPEVIYQKLIQPQNSLTIEKWSSIFYKLADPTRFNWHVEVEDDVAIELIRYRLHCEKVADNLPDHKEIQKAELAHRYFKALKLAGAYAFVDGSTTIDLNCLKQAILLVEESGDAFQVILNREKTYVKLAKYIASEGTELTHADLHEALPFYKSSNAARNEMMTLATAWGYKNHIVITKNYTDGIEFFKGKTLKETNLNELRLSYSSHQAYNYTNELAPFDQLTQLVTLKDHHWCNHSFASGHRSEDTTITGFNMIVVDVDGGTSVKLATELLAEYKYFIYTTKRHTEESNRFRLILPINYHLDLDATDYKEFMSMVTAWLPFEIDESANQRSRKWLTNDNAQVFSNTEGVVLDALKFIPKTSKNEQFKQQNLSYESLNNLERWFAKEISIGSRNNNLIKYAFVLADSGMELIDISTHIHDFNKKLSNPLTADEINTTILTTVAKRMP